MARKSKLLGDLNTRRQAVETKLLSWYPNLEILEHYVTANAKMKFRCKRCGNVFYRQPSNMMYDCNRTKYGCPKCNISDRVAGQTISLDEALNRIHNRFPNIEYISGYKNYHDSAVFKCLTCGKTFERAPVTFETSRSGCPYCTRKIWGKYHRLDSKQYEKRFNDKFPNLTLSTKYVNGRTDIKVKCDICGSVWLTNPISLLARKFGCQVCANRHSGLGDRKSQQQFWNDLKIVNSNVLVMEKYKGNKVPIKVKCKVCGYIWKARPNDLLTGRGRCCRCAYAKIAYGKANYCKAYRQVRTKHSDESFQHYNREAFVYYFKKKHPNARLLTMFEGIDKLIKAKCLKCGHIRVAKAASLLFSPVCIECEHVDGYASKGEYTIADLLTKAQLIYQYPYIPDDLVDKSALHYDFRVNGHYLIEFQGKQHYEPVDRYGGVERFKVQQKHDQMKRQWARKHHFVLIEIRFNESIKEKLGQYFPRVLNCNLEEKFISIHRFGRHRLSVCLNAQLMEELNDLNNKRPFSQFMSSLILDADNHNLDLIQPKYEQVKSQEAVVTKTVLLSDPAYTVFESCQDKFDSNSAELRAFLHTYYLYQKELKETQGD